MSLPNNAEKVFEGKIFDVYQWEQVMFDWKKKIFEKLKRTDTVDIVAITKDNKIIIVKEEQPWREPFYWLVWWTCEKWEEPIESAKRELLEETWLISNEWKLFWKYRKSSKIDYESYIYIARNCTKIQWQKLDPGWEKIKISEKTWNL